jgi:hypothetical protein
MDSKGRNAKSFEMNFLRQFRQFLRAAYDLEQVGTICLFGNHSVVV